MMTIIWTHSRRKEPVNRYSWIGGWIGERELPTAQEIPERIVFCGMQYY